MLSEGSAECGWGDQPNDLTFMTNGVRGNAKMRNYDGEGYPFSNGKICEPPLLEGKM